MRVLQHGRPWYSAVGITALLGLVWVGCSDNSKDPVAPTPGLDECGAQNIFYRRDFTAPTRIDNKWFPLQPGTQMVLDGTANRGNGVLPHRIVFTVTEVTKVINGVRTVVLWDRDYNGGVLGEAELAFFAQDKFGNVWSLGEYPEEFENGEFIGAPSTWIAGLSGAEAGIHMLGEPQGGFRYLQGWAPDINFLDCAGVFTSGLTVCVPFNCYENVLETDETSPLEVGSGHQRKYYAPGVGNIRIGAVGDPEAETLMLTNAVHLSPEVLAEANAEALKLDKRGYGSSDVYRLTEPAQLLP